ncbi:MAG: hypothetical protein R2744_05280 [Bacteroidales bacterium]
MQYTFPSISTGGRFNQTLWPYFRLSYSNNYFYQEDGAYYDYGLSTCYIASLFLKPPPDGRRDIWPRWGQVIVMNHLFSPTDGDLYGPVTSARIFLYFPDWLQTIRSDCPSGRKKEFRETADYKRSITTQGIQGCYPEKVTALSFDYTLPMHIPTLISGPLLYLQRLRAALFYDYAKAARNYYYLEEVMVEGTKIFSSYGTEFLADFYLLRIPFRFSSGVRLHGCHRKTSHTSVPV